MQNGHQSVFKDEQCGSSNGSAQKSAQHADQHTFGQYHAGKLAAVRTQTSQDTEFFGSLVDGDGEDAQ